MKRGQFYLVAAMIIISIIVGIILFRNYISERPREKVYDLKEDLNIEVANVIDYGTYNELNDTSMENLLRGFIESYSQFGEIEKLLFIFGNKDNITVFTYQQLAEEISINVGAGDVLVIGNPGVINTTTFTPTGNKVKIIIYGNPYTFNLNKGENFYFIIVSTVEGNQIILPSEEVLIKKCNQLDGEICAGTCNWLHFFILPS